MYTILFKIAKIALEYAAFDGLIHGSKLVFRKVFKAEGKQLCKYTLAKLGGGALAALTATKVAVWGVETTHNALNTVLYITVALVVLKAIALAIEFLNARKKNN